MVGWFKSQSFKNRIWFVHYGNASGALWQKMREYLKKGKEGRIIVIIRKKGGGAEMITKTLSRRHEVTVVTPASDAVNLAS